MIRLVMFLLVSGLLVMAAACDDDVGVRGSGDLVTKEYEFEDFAKVELANSFRAGITYADVFSVSLEVDDNILDLVEVTQDGDTLRLQLESGSSVFSATLEATITMPEVVSLDLSGASRATIAGFENADALEARLSGASRLQGGLDVTRLDLQLSGASRVSIEGGGTEADIDASGASTVDLEDFLLEIAHVTFSGATNGTVNVRDALGPVEVSGASHLRYVGTPSLSGVDISGASSVDPAE